MAKPRRKMIGKETLHRHGDHSWVGYFNGYPVSFSAYLGRHSRKVIGWQASSSAKLPDTGWPRRPAFSTEGNSLKLCVERARAFFGEEPPHPMELR